MNPQRTNDAASTTPRPAVRIRRGSRPATPMRVYIWSRPAPDGKAPPPPTQTGEPAPVVIELAAWLRTFMIVAAALVTVPLAGLIGYRQGFAESVGVPDLQRQFGSSLTDGVQLILAAPLRIFEAGLADTLSLMLAMLLVVTGAGALTLALIGNRSIDESGDVAEPSPTARVAAALGLVVCALVSIAQIVWVIARSQAALGEVMPWTAEAFAPWHESVRITAGVDLIALAAAVVWLLVAVRLRWMLWLRALTLVLCGFAIAALFTAASMTNCIASQVDQQRSLLLRGDSTGAAASDLILGHTSTHLAIVRDGGQLELISPDITITVAGRQSLAEFIGE